MSYRKKKRMECSACYSCGWLINDEDQTPFYDTTFADLQPGDEVVRCSKCNSIDQTIAVQRKPRKNSNWDRYKTH